MLTKAQKLRVMVDKVAQVSKLANIPAQLRKLRHE